MKALLFIIFLINSALLCHAEPLPDPRYPELLSLNLKEGDKFTILEYKQKLESVFLKLSGKDKKISKEEYLELGKGWRASDREKLNANFYKKGYSSEEVRDANEKIESIMRDGDLRRFNQADSDKNGFLNMDEYSHHVSVDSFNPIDSNNDKSIDRKEIETFKSIMFSIRDKANEAVDNLKRLDVDKADKDMEELDSMANQLLRK